MIIKNIIKKLNLKPLADYQLAYLIVILVFLRMINFQYDNDFWFTINQGRYVLEHSFPTIAINSIHNIDFIYQSWGTGTLFYIVYNYLGLYGMVFLLIAIVSLTMYFFYKLCFLVSSNKRRSLYITFLFFLLYTPFITTRPHIFTVLNLTIMLYLLESYIQKDDIKYLYGLPIISLLQINMHGIYFILLLIIISPFLINSFKFKFLNVKSNGYRKKPLIIAFICMILTGFINPYGYKTIIYGFSSYDSTGLFNNTIAELSALNFHKIYDKIFIVTIIITYILYFNKKKEIPLRYYLLLFGTTYLAFDAVKSFYLFLICSFYPLAYIYSNNKKTKKEYQFSKIYHIFHGSFTVVLCIFCFLNIKNPQLPEISKYIDYLDENVANKENMKLFTDYMDGSYAEYRGYNCYLDPRGEIFLKSNNKKEDIYEEYNNVSIFKINYKDFIDKYKFDYMLIKNESELGRLMKYDAYKYKNVMEDANYTLYMLDRR